MKKRNLIPEKNRKNKFELERQGSSKDIYAIDDKSIGFKFTDRYSVFDVGVAPDEIPGKGKAICACAVKSFKIAAAIGIPTHFMEQIDETMIRVERANIITDRPLKQSDENYVVPAEWIYRLKVAGSIERDFKSGRKRPEHYGLPMAIIPNTGTPFPYPVHMFTSKFEKIDREITIEEACYMCGLTIKDLQEYWSMIDRLTGAVAYEAKMAGFDVVDGKMECLMGKDRQKKIGDVFCTQDEDRFCIIESDGTIEHYSKEYIRQLHIASGYYAALMQCRKEGRPDIPIPRLDQDQIAEIRERYITVARTYASDIY